MLTLSGFIRAFLFRVFVSDISKVSFPIEFRSITHKIVEFYVFIVKNEITMQLSIFLQISCANEISFV